MNYKKALNYAFQKLNTQCPEGVKCPKNTKYPKSKNKYIINPRLEAEILLSKISGKNREFILAHSENKINLIKYLKFNYLIYKRLRNYPLAYLEREKYFYGYRFKVNKNTLIPRPESEIMVAEIINLIKNSPRDKYSFFDIGTGTGCIIISLLKDLGKKFPKVDLENSFAIDISSQALRVAKQNSIFHKLDQKIIFLNANLLDPIIKKRERNNYKQHLIISANLPYLNSEQLKHPTIKYEPSLALYGGLEGLDYYRKLLKQIKIIKKNYKKISLFMEIDPQQRKALKALILKVDREAKIETKKDLKGLSRLIYASFKTN